MLGAGVPPLELDDGVILVTSAVWLSLSRFPASCSLVSPAAGNDCGPVQEN